MSNDMNWSIENYKKLAKTLSRYPKAISGGIKGEPQEQVLSHLYFELIERCNAIQENISKLIKVSLLTPEEVEDIIFEIDMQLDFMLNNMKSSGRYDTLINKYSD